MYFPKKRRIIALIAGIVCAGCSDSDRTNSATNPMPTNIYITSESTRVVGAVIDGEYAFFLNLGYNDDNNCKLSGETLYAAVEVYSGNKLCISPEYGYNEHGYASIDEDEILLSHNDSFSPFDWNFNLYFDGSEEGESEFALKLYQPETDTYYITPRHKLKISLKPSSIGTEEWWWITAEVTVSEP